MNLSRAAGFSPYDSTYPLNNRRPSGAPNILTNNGLFGVSTRSGPTQHPFQRHITSRKSDPFARVIPGALTRRSQDALGGEQGRLVSTAKSPLTPAANLPMTLRNRTQPPILSNNRPHVLQGAYWEDNCTHFEPKDPVSNDTWRPSNLQCSTSASSCTNNMAEKLSFATKDILIRNRARVIRASYLHENAKFEGDLSKYLEKKDTRQVPDKVVDLLLGFINTESYNNDDLVDEVTLNILATSVGARSVVDHSLSRLKNIKAKDVATADMAKIAAMVLMCSKADKGLTAWLKKTMEADERALFMKMWSTREYRDIVSERPEVDIALRRLMEVIGAPKDDGYRNL